jgi:hypothetical protein
MARISVTLERIGDCNAGRWRGEISGFRAGRVDIDAIGDASMLARLFGGLGRLEIDERRAANNTWQPPVQEAPPIPVEARAQPTRGHTSTITVKSRAEIARQRNGEL